MTRYTVNAAIVAAYESREMSGLGIPRLEKHLALDVVRT